MWCKACMSQLCTLHTTIHSLVDHPKIYEIQIYLKFQQPQYFSDCQILCFLVIIDVSRMVEVKQTVD
jgi:hypothetical protein